MSRPQNKSSAEQLSYLRYISAQKECLEQSRNIDRSIEGRDKVRKFWSELAAILNNMDGATRTPKQWKQTWNDLKSSARRKERKLKALGSDSVSSTGKESPKIYHLSEMDEAVMDVIEPMAGANSNDGVTSEKAENSSSIEPKQEPTSPGPSNEKENSQDEMVDVTEGQDPEESELFKILKDKPPFITSQAPKKSKKNKSLKKEDDFDYKRRKLELKKESIKIKQQKNELLIERNRLMQGQNDAFLRIANVLDEFLTKLLLNNS